MPSYVDPATLTGGIPESGEIIHSAQIAQMIYNQQDHQAAVVANAAAITAETTRATGAETTLTTNLNAEIVARQAAVATISGGTP